MATTTDPPVPVTGAGAATLHPRGPFSLDEFSGTDHHGVALDQLARVLRVARPTPATTTSPTRRTR